MMETDRIDIDLLIDEIEKKDRQFGILNAQITRIECELVTLGRVCGNVW
jgi:hypothetical protein